jgi:SAM-dependent methyltransferase
MPNDDASSSFSSRTYWETRYAGGGNSGAGSYGVLANYKSAFLNRFFSQRDVKSVVDFGSGDGNQLAVLRIAAYTGVDVSETAIELCKAQFEGRKGWQFVHDDGSQDLQFTADVGLSLDVIYHLVEDDVFERYMRRLFKSAGRYVVVYSTDFNEWAEAPHVRHRSVTAWTARNIKGWDVIARPQNPYFFREYDDRNTTFAGFIIFGKSGDAGQAAESSAVEGEVPRGEPAQAPDAGGKTLQREGSKSRVAEGKASKQEPAETPDAKRGVPANLVPDDPPLKPDDEQKQHDG